MVDNPYYAHGKKAVAVERCLDRKPTCQDCRLQDIEKVKSAHFTICQKPWTCSFHDNPRNSVLCIKFHAKWFALRDEFERSAGLDLVYRKSDTKYKDSLGMCTGYGHDKYIPIPISA